MHVKHLPVRYFSDRWTSQMTFNAHHNTFSGAGRLHSHLCIHSPGGAFSVIPFRKAAIL